MQKKPRWGLITIVTFVVAVSAVALIAWIQSRPGPREELKRRVLALRERGVAFSTDEVTNRPERLQQENPYRGAMDALPDQLGTRDALPESPLETIPEQHLARDLLWRAERTPGQRTSAASLRILADLLEQRTQALELADRAASLPAHGFALELDEVGAPRELSTLRDLRELFNMMGLRCLFYAHRCEPGALAPALRSLALVPRALGEPVVGTEAMIRAQMDIVISTLTAECLNLCVVPSERLAGLQQAVATEQKALSLGRSVAALRAVALQALPEAWTDVSVRPDGERLEAAAARVLYQLDAVAIAEDLMEQPEPERLERLPDLMDFLAGSPPMSVFVPGRRTAKFLANTILLDVRARAHMRVLRMLLAAERYRQEQGTWPPTAEALVPEYLPRLPADPAAESATLGYRVEADGVVVSGSGHEDLRRYEEISLKLLNPELRGAEQGTFYEEIMNLEDWEPALRAQALYRLGFTREELRQAGFTTEELGGWAPDMEQPPADDPPEE